MRAVVETEPGVFEMAAEVDDFPVSWVTWYGARDACLWEGKTMCTWDVFYSACSNGGQWYFPWGGETGGNPTWDGWIDAWEPRCICGGASTRVGWAEDCEGSIDGLFDMAGNVGEWGGTKELDGFWWLMGGSYNSLYIEDDPGDDMAGAGCLFPDDPVSWEVDEPPMELPPEEVEPPTYPPTDDLGFRCCVFLEE